MEKKNRKNRIKIEKYECPFNIRNLKIEECYYGMGRNKCNYFIKYKDGYIICNYKIKEPSLFTEKEMKGE